jgi:hypothetical protein
VATIYPLADGRDQILAVFRGLWKKAPKTVRSSSASSEEAKEVEPRNKAGVLVTK